MTNLAYTRFNNKWQHPIELTIFIVWPCSICAAATFGAEQFSSRIHPAGETVNWISNRVLWHEQHAISCWICWTLVHSMKFSKSRQVNCISFRWGPFKVIYKMVPHFSSAEVININYCLYICQATRTRTRSTVTETDVNANTSNCIWSFYFLFQIFFVIKNRIRFDCNVCDTPWVYYYSHHLLHFVCFPFFSFCFVWIWNRMLCNSVSHVSTNHLSRLTFPTYFFLEKVFQYFSSARWMADGYYGTADILWCTRNVHIEQINKYICKFCVMMNVYGAK